jgi:hypothetical protein
VVRDSYRTQYTKLLEIDVCTEFLEAEILVIFLALAT